jgi:hypothetical protein
MDWTPRTLVSVIGTNTAGVRNPHAVLATRWPGLGYFGIHRRFPRWRRRVRELPLADRESATPSSPGTAWTPLC